MAKKQLEDLLEKLQSGVVNLRDSLAKAGATVDRKQLDRIRYRLRKHLGETYHGIQHKAAIFTAKVKDVQWKEIMTQVKTGDVMAVLRTNRPVALAGASLIIFSALGVYSFVNIDKGYFAPKQVDFIGETVAARDTATVSKPTLANICNVDPARRIGITGYSIQANGRTVGFALTQGEAYQILDTLKKTYTPEGALESWFVETVVVREDRLDIVKHNPEGTVEDSVQAIARGTDEKREHVIQEGENLWLIAKKYKIPVDTLIAANPGINPEKVKIDQKISLIVPKPLISVACKEIKEYNEAIPFEVAYEESASIYKGETSVKRAGVQGERYVKAEIVSVNGRETERKVLEENISKNPVGKIVVKGTKNPPPKIGSGTFVWPTSRGVITSKFGVRWGQLHAGLDIGLPTGSSVKAADGGKVTFSGYKNGLGLCVVLDHGGGFTTVYGHNSVLLVKAGQSVFKGQEISKSGNTGYSTGPHLHFEVRKNGKAYDPLTFVRK